MTVHHTSIRMLAEEMRRVPIELRREMRPRIRLAGQSVVNDIRSNAAWSKRIPGAVRMSVSFSSKTGGVRIWVDSRKAPEARPLEGLSARGGSFRHPVYGHTDRWVSQPARPFFFPAVQRNRGKVRAAVEDAVRASYPKGSGA